MKSAKGQNTNFTGRGSWLKFALAFAFIALAYGTIEANAQSNVRPPAGAVNIDPATQLEGGNVPGGTLGTQSPADLWRNVRKGVTGKVSIPDTKAAVLVQSEGEAWRQLRNGPISSRGAWSLAGVVGLLLVFFLVRGRINIDAGPSGRTITRFASVERMGHWLLAVSFIVLALSGLNIMYGKFFLLPVIGKSAFAGLTETGKWLHNYMAFAFMAGLVMVLILWIKENFPNKYDIIWLAKGGGMLSKGSHPPAKKFNAGQKVLFWLVILCGASISLSGLSMLFPYEMPLFAKTFALLNVVGFDLPTELSGNQEMQYANTWHAILALFLTCVIIAHIYIGTIGMEGAFDAMGSGEVDANWAKEHHSVWYEEEAPQSGGSAPSTPSSSGTGFIPAE